MCYQYSTQSHTKNREKLKSFIDRNNLADVWRTLNPELERYTWRQNIPNIQCRLDFFIISIGLLIVVNNVDIIYGYKSYHSFISVEIEKNSFARGKDFLSSINDSCNNVLSVFNP
jgi:exonuclease III